MARPHFNPGPCGLSGKHVAKGDHVVCIERSDFAPQPPVFEQGQWFRPETGENGFAQGPGGCTHLNVNSTNATSPRRAIEGNINQLVPGDDARRCCSLLQVLVIPKPIPKKPWSDFLYRSKFCCSTYLREVGSDTICTKDSSIAKKLMIETICS